jgi:hypothetical protein
MAAQVGHDQPVPRRKRLGRGQPKFVIYREWVEQDNRGAVAENRISKCRVIALDAVHEHD